jgi:hypothetical protein
MSSDAARANASVRTGTNVDRSDSIATVDVSSSILKYGSSPSLDALLDADEVHAVLAKRLDLPRSPPQVPAAECLD